MSEITIGYKSLGVLDRKALVGTPLNDDLYDGGMVALSECRIPGRGVLRAGEGGVTFLAMTRSAEFFFTGRGGDMEVTINSNAGLFPTFPLFPAQMKPPVKAVMLDLDGTCVKSEKFWIKTILDTVNAARGVHGLRPIERFRDEELPFVSGRTVPEHLMYCIENYCPASLLADMQRIYNEISEDYMVRMERGEIEIDAFEPADGLKGLLLWLKEQNIKIALVTSGLYYKAGPELDQAMVKMGLGDPNTFFDAIITSGTLAGGGKPGTVGNAIAKPWPHIYFEAAQVMGFTMEERSHFVGVGDSNSDAGSIRLMGVPFIGLDDGNIRMGGTMALCNHFVEGLPQLLEVLKRNIV